MKNNIFIEEVVAVYSGKKDAIRSRLKEFSLVKESDYFYELCFCLLTPQSKARNAMKVVSRLEQNDFLNAKFNPETIVRDPENYIRFHATKSQRLLQLAETYSVVLDILRLNIIAQEKRLLLKDCVKGFGMKEASHFMRNVGYRGLAILDRHILRMLTRCEVFDKLPDVSSQKIYRSVEEKFIDFSNEINIDMDELDLLFWSMVAGEILK